MMTKYWLGSLLLIPHQTVTLCHLPIKTSFIICSHLSVSNSSVQSDHMGQTSLPVFISELDRVINFLFLVPLLTHTGTGNSLQELQIWKRHDLVSSPPQVGPFYSPSNPCGFSFLHFHLLPKISHDRQP